MLNPNAQPFHLPHHHHHNLPSSFPLYYGPHSPPQPPFHTYHDQLSPPQLFHTYSSYPTFFPRPSHHYKPFSCLPPPPPPPPLLSPSLSLIKDVQLPLKTPPKSLLPSLDFKRLMFHHHVPPRRQTPPRKTIPFNDGHFCSFQKRKQKKVVKKWAPKDTGLDFKESEAEVHGKTTIMIKNIPCRLSRENLIELLDEHCLQENKKEKQSCISEYDFVYLPIDFKRNLRRGLNVGYAFVNFTSPIAAVRFYNSYNHYKWMLYGSQKICQVKYAKFQGKEALEKNFCNMYFDCDKEEYLPLVFTPPRNGSTSTWCAACLGMRRRIPKVAK